MIGGREERGIRAPSFGESSTRGPRGNLGELGGPQPSCSEDAPVGGGGVQTVVPVFPPAAVLVMGMARASRPLLRALGVEVQLRRPQASSALPCSREGDPRLPLL